MDRSRSEYVTVRTSAAEQYPAHATAGPNTANVVLEADGSRWPKSPCEIACATLSEADTDDPDTRSPQVTPASPMLQYTFLPARSRGLLVPDTVDSDAAVSEFWAEATSSPEVVKLQQEVGRVRQLATPGFAAETAETAVPAIAAEKAMAAVPAIAETDVGTTVDRSPPIATTEGVCLSEEVHSKTNKELFDEFDLGNENAARLCALSKSRLWFLGTGCAVPSKYRNVSGILMQLLSHISLDAVDGSPLKPQLIASSSLTSTSAATATTAAAATTTTTPTTMASLSSMMLLDCGEGTWQQIVRMAYNSPSLLYTSAAASPSKYGKLYLFI